MILFSYRVEVQKDGPDEWMAVAPQYPNVVGFGETIREAAGKLVEDLVLSELDRYSVNL